MRPRAPASRRSTRPCAPGAASCSRLTLEKPRPGSRMMRRSSTPAATSAPTRAASSDLTSATTSAYVSLRVHVGRVRSPVHRDIVDVERRRRSRPCRGRRAPRDVVDEARARGDRGARRARPHRVDAHRHARGRERLDHGDHARELLGRIHALRARTRRLAPDVDDVGAVGGERESAGDRRVGARVEAAVAEAIGRDVENPHHERAGCDRQGGSGRAAGGCDRPLAPRIGYFPTMRLMASARVAPSRMSPRTALVTVREPGLRTPRIDMHRCSASTTTITPRAPRCSTRASAT